MIYRFRVMFEDKEDIFRDIEIKTTQTFTDFHQIIQMAIGFDNKHNASFFTSDAQWRKETEIILNDDGAGKKLMGKTKIAACVDDPHQRFIYVYDPSVGWTLLVELFKIIADDPKAQYPLIVKTEGKAPKQYKKNIPPPVVDDEEDMSDELLTEKIFQSEESYDKGGSDDEEEDALIDGEEEEGNSEFGDNEHPEDLSSDEH